MSVEIEDYFKQHPFEANIISQLCRNELMKVERDYYPTNNTTMHIYLSPGKHAEKILETANAIMKQIGENN